jgi:hypothetical protein
MDWFLITGCSVGIGLIILIVFMMIQAVRLLKEL